MINLLVNLIFNITKKKSRDMISPENFLANSKNVLVLLPEEVELLEDTNFLINQLSKKIFRCTFLIEENIYKNFDFTPSCAVIVYTKKHKNFLKLPNKNLLAMLKVKNFDTVIDCNLSESNFHYWISRSLNAKYKVSLFRKNSTRFNNLVMKLKSVNSTREAYSKFLQILNL